MALVVGTNCGFVTARPTGDPGAGSNDQIMDNNVVAFKVVAPANSTVTEIGWYCYNATEAANFQVGLYTHSEGTGFPDTLVAAAAEEAKGTSAGWKYKAYSANITSGTTYWVAVQLDDTTTTTYTSYTTGESSAYWYAEDNAETALPDPWDTQDNFSNEIIFAIYALYGGSDYTLSGIGDGTNDNVADAPALVQEHVLLGIVELFGKLKKWWRTVIDLKAKYPAWGF